jgi:hypothetical protein
MALWRTSFRRRVVKQKRLAAPLKFDLVIRGCEMGIARNPRAECLTHSGMLEDHGL